MRRILHTLALTCLNGARILSIKASENAKSGEYWIKLEKGKQKVYCDMETDGGGWTLFLNYRHFPGSEVLLNESKIPSNLKTNSHMYLSAAGFSGRDVKEVRFLCSEKLKGGNFYWHFKTYGDGVIQTALTGDQTYLKKTDLLASYVELQKPSFFKNKFKKVFERDYVKKISHVGKNKRGGFTHTPFGSSTYNSFWTIGGDNKNRFECGSYHENNGAYVSPDQNPNMIFTHHTIWFRGNPPSSEEHKERFKLSILK